MLISITLSMGCGFLSPQSPVKKMLGKNIKSSKLHNLAKDTKMRKLLVTLTPSTHFSFPYKENE